jgi:uncharacterized damage-inducible protein DinB
MKRLLAALVLFAIPALCADDALVSTLVKHWQTSKAYTIAIAEQMPEDGYASKPNPDEMTFGGQLAHIAQANAFFLSKVSGTESPIGKPEKMDKATVIKLLNDSFDYTIKSVQGLTPEQLAKVTDFGEGKMSGLDAILLALDHTTHHRGQCIVYLRVKGIKPTDYRY